MEFAGKYPATYCVYCEPAQDNKVVQYLNMLGYHAVSPQQVKRFYHDGVERTRKVPLLPRYVFFEATEEPDWGGLREAPSILRVLQYGDGERAFREEDLEFVRWIQACGGLLKVSQVMQVGAKINVIDGPLKHYEGRIVEVKKHRRMVAVEISTEGHIAKIWCPVEYLEKA